MRMYNRLAREAPKELDRGPIKLDDADEQD